MLPVVATLAGLVVAPAILCALTYNRLVVLRARLHNAFSQIDVQLKRRYDLIPNLVSAARAALGHEREVLEGVTRARAEAVRARALAAQDPGEATGVRELVAAEIALSAVLGRFVGLVEAYPTLAAEAAVRRLMEELTSTENRIAFARQAFNDAVMRFNAYREALPGALLASPAGFREAEYFRISEDRERAAVSVKLDGAA